MSHSPSTVPSTTGPHDSISADSNICLYDTFANPDLPKCGPCNPNASCFPESNEPMWLYCYMTMLPTMSPYSFGYVLVLFPRFHNGPNPSHRHTHLMISVDPSESFGSALCQRYTPHLRQSLLLFTDPYVSKHTHTRWVHVHSTELILQFACALLRAHHIFTASLCAG